MSASKKQAAVEVDTQVAAPVTAQSFLDLVNAPQNFELVHDVPNLGTVGVLKMNLGQRNNVLKKWGELEATKTNTITFSAIVIQATVTDEQGKPLLSSVPLEKINQLPSEVADPIFAAASKLNGFTATAVSDAEKN